MKYATFSHCCGLCTKWMLENWVWETLLIMCWDLMDFLMVSGNIRKEILTICKVISFILVWQLKKLGSLFILLHIHMLKARQVKSCLDTWFCSNITSIDFGGEWTEPDCFKFWISCYSLSYRSALNICIFKQTQNHVTWSALFQTYRLI